MDKKSVMNLWKQIQNTNSLTHSCTHTSSKQKHVTFRKRENKLTDICPANSGQSTDSSAFTSSSGISWLTVSMFPGRMAWWWGNMPAQWLPAGQRKVNICKNTQGDSRGKAFDICLYWAKVQPGQWLKAWVADVPGMTRRAPFSSSESSKASHTERTGPPSIPQYLRTKQLHLDTDKTKQTFKVFFFTFRVQIYLISWCQATYGSPFSPPLPSGLSVGYLQMKRESSRMTSGPRMALTTCKICGCFVRSLTHGYWRWTLWRLYWVYSSPEKMDTLVPLTRISN